jgi:hypothetical protein
VLIESAAFHILTRINLLDQRKRSLPDDKSVMGSSLFVSFHLPLVTRLSSLVRLAVASL